MSKKYLRKLTGGIHMFELKATNENIENSLITNSLDRNKTVFQFLKIRVKNIPFYEGKCKYVVFLRRIISF